MNFEEKMRNLDQYLQDILLGKKEFLEDEEQDLVQNTILDLVSEITENPDRGVWSFYEPYRDGLPTFVIMEVLITLCKKFLEENSICALRALEETMPLIPRTMGIGCANRRRQMQWVLARLKEIRKEYFEVESELIKGRKSLD